MSVMLEFGMFPTDKGESVSKYVSRIIKAIDQSGVNYQLGPMGTVIETETMEEALAIIQLAYNQLDDCDRIYSALKFDIRKSKKIDLTSKVKSVEKHIGNVSK